MKRIVIALSGGLDSTTALWWALSQGAEKVLAVTAQYGSIHNSAEISAAWQVVKQAGRRVSIDIRRITLPDVFADSDSALMGKKAMPEVSYEAIEHAEGPSPTVVPFRNANILAACAALAESGGYDTVITGVHATDYQGWAYPDCSPEFMGAFAAAIYVGTYHKVRLIVPFQHWSKTDVVNAAARLKAPLEFTWSCYQGQPPTQCGVCPTCVERIAAFKRAGYADPVPYKIHINWEGCMPWPTLALLGGAK